MDQSIHIAAAHGYCDVVRSLINDYGVNPASQAKVYYTLSPIYMNICLVACL